MMDKADRLNTLESSPKSPFQFGLMKGLLHNASYSASSCSFDTDCEEERSAAINTVKFSASASSSSFKNLSLEELKRSTHTHLRPTMEKAHEVQAAMHQSHARIQGIMDRASLLGIAISPLAFQASKAKLIEDHMDKATRPAKAALKVFHSMQKLHGILSVGPFQDVGYYVQALAQYQQHMKFMHQYSPLVIEALAEGVTFLKGSRMIDRFHMEELLEVIRTLQSLLVGQEHLAMSKNVVDHALEHLLIAFRRIIRDYIKPMDLSQCLIDHSSAVAGRWAIRLQRALPSPVLQILQAIAERLAFNNKLRDCLEIYQLERGYKLKESLETLQSSSYLRYQTPDAIDIVDWAILEGHLAMWAVHLDVFVSDLLASEYTFCKQVFSQVRADGATSAWKDGFGKMAMQVGLASFIEFGVAFTKSHMEPQKLFKLLDIFDCLEKLNPKFEEMFYSGGGGWVCKDIQKRVGSLNRRVVKGVAMVLEEMKYRVEAQEEGSKGSLDMSKGWAVLKLVSYTVNYLKYTLSEWYKPLLCRALKADQILNEARYMDARATDTGGEEAVQQLVHMAVLEIMQALDNNVTTTAKRLLGVPAYASLFLMNNYDYIHTRCLKSDVGALLGEDWLQKQLDKMELCAMQYKQEAWGQLIALVDCEGIGSSFSSMISSGSSVGRELIRQRARAFQVSLDNLIARHGAWCIPNEDLKKRICHDVVQSVVPAYRDFLGIYFHLLAANPLPVTQNGDMPGQVSLYDSPRTTKSYARLDSAIIQYTPERVEHMLASIFEGKHQPLHHLQGAQTHTNRDKNMNTSISDNGSVSDFY